jgi:hypothetical protein
MEDTQGNYSQKDEIRVMDVHMGNEGTNSNVHGEGKEESMNLVETIKNLQKAVQSHKVDCWHRGRPRVQCFNKHQKNPIYHPFQQHL